MTAKFILALLFLVSVAVAGAVFARAISREPPAAAAPPPTPPISTREVLAAAAALPEGTLLRPRDLRWATLAAAEPPVGVIERPATGRDAKSDDDVPAEVLGSVLRRAVAAGNPIVRGEFVRPGDRDFLRLVLAPGKRAISITPASGGVLLNPGDRVDVILTQNFGAEVPIGRRMAGETVADDILLLAVEGGSAKSDAPAQPRGVILEVNPQQAEKIIVANGLGKLLLILRGTAPEGAGTPLTAAPEPGSGRPTWAGDVSSALAGVAPPPDRPVDGTTVDVIRGTKSEAIAIKGR